MFLAEFHDVDGIVGTDKLSDNLFGDIPANVFTVIRLVFLSLLFRFFKNLESSIVIMGIIMIIVDVEDQRPLFEL